MSPEAPQSRLAGPPPPGPADRRTFDEAQRRSRRATWLVTGLSAVTVAAMGVAVGAVLVPMLWGMLTYGLSVGLGVLLTVVVMPLTLGSAVLPFLTPLADGASAIVGAMSSVEDALERLPPRQPLARLAAVVLPGVVLIGLCWLVIHRLFRRAGTGGAILALGAREPRPGDLEEQQLVNIVQEMAIAAGIAPLRVLLLDGDRPNAAALGRSAEDAAVVVGRRILDELDRDETQGIVGHLVGSVANGDLRIAFATASVFETFGLLLALLDAPVSPAARATLARLWAFAKTARDPRTAITEADLVAAMLTEGTSLARLEDVTRAMQRAIDKIRGLGFLNPLRMTRLALFVPYALASLVARVVLFLTVGVLLGPLVALAWRARRHLADATAVQLTRYPVGLASALVWLVDHGTTVPGAEWAAHLFIVGPEVFTDRARIRYDAEMAEIRRLSGFTERYEQGRAAAAALRAVREQADAAAEGGLARRAGIPFGFHPSLRRRLRRLARMAAAPAAP